MPTKSDDQEPPTDTSTSEIFSNFEKLLSMTNRIVDKMGPCAPAVGNENLHGNSRASQPLRGCGNQTWNVLGGGGLFPQSPRPSQVQGESSGGGCSFAQWLPPAHFKANTDEVQPSFAFPHTVCLEEQSLELTQKRQPAEEKGKGLKDLSPEGQRRRGSRSHSTSACNNSGERSVEESESTGCGSSDKTWSVPTEQSPSSCEYIFQSDGATSVSASISEGLEEEAPPPIIVHSRKPKTRSAACSEGLRRRRLELKSRSESCTKRGVASAKAQKKFAVDNSVAHQEQKQAVVMPKTGVSTEKETFQAWKKPRKRVGEGSQKNQPVLQMSPTAQNLVTTRQVRIEKPRGMKNTTGAKSCVLQSSEGVEQSGLKSTNDYRSAKGGNRSPEKSKVSSETGRRESFAIVKEASVPDLMIHKETGRTLNPVEGGGVNADVVFTQRSGKERAKSPPLNLRRRPQSPALPEESDSYGAARNRTSDSFVREFEENGGDRQRRFGESSRQRKRGRGAERYSNEESEYYSEMAGRQERGMGFRVQRQRRGRSKESHRHGSRRYTGCHEGDSMEEDSPISSLDRHQRRVRGHRDGLRDIRREGRKKRQYSEDILSGRSSAEPESYEAMVEVKTESQKRQEWCSRQGEREGERRIRERQGLKGHYITVNHVGVPYGFGVGAWKQELNRLTSALDPSVTNIWYQREEDMSLLRRFLKDTFEYSAPVDRGHIRKLAGKYVTQRRSRILSSMKEGDDCPSGMNDKLWKRLDRIRQDPHREELSQRMKYANASRVNPGRTGPKGEDGIREDLEKALGREPDPEEVEFKMRRKKGYAGVSKKRRERMRKQSSPSVDEEDDDRSLDRTDADNSMAVMEVRVDAGEETANPDQILMLEMQKELQSLRAELNAARKPRMETGTLDCGPSSSMPACGPESNTTSNHLNSLHADAAIVTKATERDLSKGQRNTASSHTKKLRGSRKV